MKRKFIYTFAVLVLALIIVTLLLPSTKTYTVTENISCSKSVVNRLMTNKNKWQQWWPGQKLAEKKFSFDNCEYHLDKLFFNNALLTISHQADSAKANLIVSDIDSGHTHLELVVSLPEVNGIEKLTSFFSKNPFKENVTAFLKSVKASFENEEIVYGMRVQQEKVKDSALISLKQQFDHYPSTSEIYSMISQIKNFVASKNGKESNPPMLNVYKDSDKDFYVMVAIPTKERMEGEGKFELKEMVLGNILTGEIKGGIYSVTKGEEELKNYVVDHGRVSPAIPYQSLITDRLSEPDTSKWVTKLYYPVY